ncbi:hypothetical protein JW848_00005, partial [Candidatus Bipolaricaulota bacterium]|nr:hypothetical protein [Candidatus Bipolaricaulota bacterium]
LKKHIRRRRIGDDGQVSHSKGEEKPFLSLSIRTTAAGSRKTERALCQLLAEDRVPAKERKPR